MIQRTSRLTELQMHYYHAALNNLQRAKQQFSATFLTAGAKKQYEKAILNYLMSLHRLDILFSAHLVFSFNTFWKKLFI